MMKDVRFAIVAKDKTKAVFNKITGGLKKMLGSVFSLKVGLVALAGIAGLGYFIKQSLESTDKLGKLSKTLGIATEDLATFELMAELGGSSLDTFAKASKQVSKNVFDFVVKSTGEAVDTFRALGITVDDLKPIMNDQVAVMGTIADGFNKLEDGSIKTALAYKLLGGRATELLPALAGGSQGFKDARIEAELLGIAMSQKAVAGVEAANDSWTRLTFLLRGVRDQLVAALAPAIEYFNDLLRNKMVDALNTNGSTVQKWAENVVIATLRMVQSIGIGIFQFLGEAIVAYNELARVVGATTIPTNWIDQLAANADSFNVSMGGLIRSVIAFGESSGLAGDAANNAFGETGNVINRVGDRLKAFGESSKDTFKQFQTAGINAVNSLENSLVNFVTTGKLNFKDMVNSMIADLARIAIQKAITGPLATGLSAIFGGFFADGGRPPVGKASIVGERGPEIFVPDSAGTIISNKNSFARGGLAGVNDNGQSITINVDARQATDPAAVRQAARAAVLEALPQTMAATENRIYSRSRRPRIA